MSVVRPPRAPLGVLLATALSLVVAAPAHAFEFAPVWGYAYIDDHPFQEPGGALLPSTQAFPRGLIRDVRPPDERDVRLTVWAFDANGDPLASYSVTEGDFESKSFDQRLDVSPGVIPYMRFDFCRFGGGHPTECLPYHYIGRPDPPTGGPSPGGGPPSPDADGDGHLPPADCDNTNSRVHPGAPEIAGNGLDDDCIGGDPPGRISAAVQTGWAVRGSRTRVTKLRVLEAPPGAAVDVVCRGRGCSFKTRSFAVGANGVVGLTRLFKRRLRPGATIGLRIVAPNAVGKFVRYRVRRGRLPMLKRLCVPPGATKAARC